MAKAAVTHPAQDRSPIDQRWIQHYCDEFLKVAQLMPEGPFRDAVLRRVECVMDLLESWQKRNNPIVEPPRPALDEAK